MKTLLFVDDEERLLHGLQRQLRPLHEEWDMHFVTNGPAALDFMAGRRVEVIVTDMMMPGMDGAQLLTEVARRHPHAVRMVLSGHAEREAILRLVGLAHQYLSKPCPMEELRLAIVRAFALRDLLGNDPLKRLTARIKALPTLPATRSQLLKELDQNIPSLPRVGELISRDIGMTAKIMQMVNSAFFGLPRQLTNPTEAVAYLGISTVRALVLSVEIFAQFDPQLCRWFSLEVLEWHSWLTGLLARRVAHLEHQSQQMLDQCFLAGLMHDVGQLVLASSLPQEYSLIIAQAREQNRPIREVEQTVLGASHAEVGAYLLGLWGLPNPIIEAVALHHEPARSAALQFSPVLAAHVADALIHERQRAATEDPPVLDLAYLEKIGLAGRIESWRAECLKEDTV